MSQFKQLQQVVPPDQFEAELQTAITAYEHMAEIFTKESEGSQTEEKVAMPASQKGGTGNEDANMKETKKKTVIRKNWLPLESDPVLITRYMGRLGIDTAK